MCLVNTEKQKKIIKVSKPAVSTEIHIIVVIRNNSNSMLLMSESCRLSLKKKNSEITKHVSYLECTCNLVTKPQTVVNAVVRDSEN